MPAFNPYSIRLQIGYKSIFDKLHKNSLAFLFDIYSRIGYNNITLTKGQALCVLSPKGGTRT